MEGVGPREDPRMIVIVVTVYGELILGGPLDGSRLVELNSTCGGGGGAFSTSPLNTKEVLVESG